MTHWVLGVLAWFLALFQCEMCNSTGRRCVGAWCIAILLILLLEEPVEQRLVLCLLAKVGQQTALSIVRSTS